MKKAYRYALISITAGLIFVGIGQLLPNKDDFLKFTDDRDAGQKAYQSSLQNEAKIKLEQEKVKLNELFDAIVKKAEQFKGSNLVFKGFYIGRPIEDAKILCDKYNFKKRFLSEWPGPIEGQKDDGKLSCHLSIDGGSLTSDGADKKVYRFDFEEDQVNVLFNSKGMSGEQFKDKFRESYNIRMEIQSELGGEWWLFTSPSEFKVKRQW